MADLIDPWASFTLDYDKLVNQFGIGKISDIIQDVKNPQILMKRGVIFGHREFNEINNLINQNKDFAVVTGMMPSGQMHIGHKMVVDQLKWYQEMGAMLSLPIADLEAYAARDMSFENLTLKGTMSTFICSPRIRNFKPLHSKLQTKPISASSKLFTVLKIPPISLTFRHL